MLDNALYTYYRTYGNKILFKYRKDGVSKSKEIDFYEPSVWIKSDNGEGEVSSIFGYPLKQIQFESISAAKEFLKSIKDVGNMGIEGNSNFANQFVIELYKGQMPKFTADDIRVGVLDIEVDAPEFPEPDEAKWPMTAITIYDSFTKTYYCFGMKDFVYDSKHELIGGLKVKYIKCETEHELLVSMLEHFKEFQYDLTTGWNSESFDMPYIINRCHKLVGVRRTNDLISPFGKVSIREIAGNFGKSQQKVDIAGLPHCDYMALYKKHNYTPRESYRIDFIASAELGVNKLSYEEEGSLRELYAENPQKYYEYNIRDVQLINMLDAQLGFLNITYTLAYYSLSNYEDTLGTVKLWEQLIAKHLYNKGQVPLFSRKFEGPGAEFDGAFVHPVQVGRHEWAVSIDLNSLYPMNEIQYNIGIETLIPTEQLPAELIQIRAKYTLDDLVNGTADLSALKKYNVAMSGSFAFYRRDKISFMAEIKDSLYSDRKKFKKMMLQAEREVQALKERASKGEDATQELHKANADVIIYYNLQMALKICLNSGYGAVGNANFLYYKVENAESITASGQLINKWTHKRANALLDKLTGKPKNRTLAGDTDSLYFGMKDIVDLLKVDGDDNSVADKLDEFMKTVMSPQVDKYSQQLCDYVNGVANKMVWEREVISPVCVFVRKKGYVMKVLDSEGVRFTEPKIKVVGLESVKSSTPEWARKLLKKCYVAALDQPESVIHSIVATARADFMKMSIEDIAMPRGVNNLEKWADAETIYVSGCPKNVKAALIHNRLVDDMKLNVPKIMSGNKIKFIDLKKPNPIRQDVIGFSWFMPKEFGLEKYVDRKNIFEVSFVSPLQVFLDALNWKTERLVTLESFFS